VDREHGWQPFDTQLFCRVLRAIAIPASIVRGTKLFSRREPFQAISQVKKRFVALVDIGFALLGLVPDVETEIHVGILRSCDITTAVAGDSTR
jgi:hypothetical protein